MSEPHLHNRQNTSQPKLQKKHQPQTETSYSYSYTKLSMDISVEMTQNISRVNEIVKIFRTDTTFLTKLPL
jgi:hypothetical protein